MYLKRTAISLEEAKEKLAGITVTPKVVRVKSVEAHGFVLAEDLRAPFPIPAFRRSGYDGYGILAHDDEDFPREFTMVDEVGAGSTHESALKSGECVRIMTGAKVPDDVAKVIMLEDTEALSGNRVRILRTSAKSNITEIGEEVARDERVIPAGTRLNAGAVSVLAAFGVSEVSVYKKPRVAVVATGSELAENARPEDGKIYNSNGPLLSGLAQENDADVTGVYELTDDLEATRELLARLTAENDLVITTGGVSVGDFDFLAVIAQENDCLFNKLAMRPGSPTTAFLMKGKPVIALSGNPSACFTGFWFFAEPLIRRFQGQTTRIRPGRGILRDGYTKKNEFDRYLNGVNGADGVSLNGHGQSSELSSLYQANCFYRIPHDTAVTAGEEVAIWWIPER
ncbi:MAG: molybdopterin molybdotransferase MoeA [Streptococcaceae bacterium]|jgi:molybdopterin molybdotransferase|nr:molybdopterin molybdotransferase MoeA [Streptococcaceae bacterium]